MRPQTQDDIIEELRLILIQQGDDSEILKEARIALGNWFADPQPRRAQTRLRVINGGGRSPKSSRGQAPLLSSVQEVP